MWSKKFQISGSAIKGSFVVASMLLLFGCKKEAVNGGGTVTPPVDTTNPPPPVFDINAIGDTYASVAPYSSFTKWSVYNAHDPSIIKDGEWYYCYSTDVQYGGAARIGIMVRRSKDLVDWQYVGWAFNGLPSITTQYITSNSATPVQGLWAPYIMKVGSEFRMYYSAASNNRTSAIALATATSPEGPWTQKGIAVASVNNGPGTNAIDPSVVVTPSGQHWMHYGSSWDGLFVLQLDPATGLAMTSGDRGVRKVRRGVTNGTINGNLEGPEIIYNAEKNMYYLFVAYDWLATKYNVRVYRSTSPSGPFLDFNGVDVDNAADNGPMILAPYRFSGHGGWQGVSHCAVFKGDDNQYFMAHQGRPSVDPGYMVLHVRKIFWTADNWPVVSPERYAYEDNANVAKDSLTGQWEQILLNYRVVPGFGNEQVFPDHQLSTNITLDAAGTINGSAANTWTYTAPNLQMNWSNGAVDKVIVQKGRDWENKKSTYVFTGLNATGLAIWGKKR